jgi:hypothetical protein
LAPEFVPYYVSGIRYQNELSNQLKLSLFLLNGWQKIQWQKKIPSLGTQLEWKNKKEFLNWTTYIGNEKLCEHVNLNMCMHLNGEKIYINPLWKGYFTRQGPRLGPISSQI